MIASPDDIPIESFLEIDVMLIYIRACLRSSCPVKVVSKNSMKIVHASITPLNGEWFMTRQHGVKDLYQSSSHCHRESVASQRVHQSTQFNQLGSRMAASQHSSVHRYAFEIVDVDTE